MGEAAVAMAPFKAWRREGPAPVIDHWRFGPMRASLRRGSDAFNWECLDLVATARGLADLQFEAGAWGPTEGHERQLDETIARLDRLTEAATQLIRAELGEMSALEWQGALVTGRPGKFQLHYWCTTGSEQLVTVPFEESRPTGVEIQD